MTALRAALAVLTVVLLVTAAVRGQNPRPPVYRLGPDDVIEIVVWDHGDVVSRPEGAYVLGPGDVVDITVWPQAELSKSATIRPDGRLTLSPVGEFSAGGVTPTALAAQIAARLRPYARDARVIVAVTKTKLERSNPFSVFGADRTVTVRFDGKISLPVIGDLDVNGQTPEQIATRIARDLQAYVKNPRVSVLVKEFKGTRVSVLGQVETPGQYKLREDARLVDAIAAAGGPTFAARLQTVTITTGPATAGRVVTVNLERVFKGEDPGGNLALQPGDIVFVPGTLSDAVGDLRQKAPTVQVQVTIRGVGP